MTTENIDHLERHYPAHPMVGVGVVVVRDSAVLLVKRGKHPGYGLWAIPGGRVELGERVRDAAAREALEECGVIVEVGDVIWVDDAIIRDANGRIEYQYVLVDFIARYAGGEPACSSDALELKWVRPEDMAGLALTSTMPPLLVKVFGLIDSGEWLGD
ncbi:MAG TPA: NUDIX hydrolase [Chloroflexota bacterium]|nr:NUDIX hydrolase [Chloroflexota bacterium]